MLNHNSLDGICAALCYALGIDPPKEAAHANPDLKAYIDSSFGEQKADRVFMFNPDAIAQWINEKYSFLLEEVYQNAELTVPLCSVMPPVTPVCFATMYTGAQPAVHKIQKYEKPILTVDTIFDALVRAGKKAALISYGGASLGKIYLNRDIDYFIMKNIDEATAVATELICQDEHDFILLYNGNYDAAGHKNGPEHLITLSELRSNAHNFAMLSHLIRRRWQGHNTLLGFAMDHGVHAIDDGCADHGFDMDDDLNIKHHYQAIVKVAPH